MGCIVFDNARGDLAKFGKLTMLLTGATVSIRLFHTQISLDVDNHFLISVSGNNATTGSDMARRFLRARIDTKLERPDRKRFSFDPRYEVVRDRAQMVIDALTIIRAYQIAGAPEQKGEPHGSFERKLCRCAGDPEPRLDADLGDGRLLGLRGPPQERRPIRPDGNNAVFPGTKCMDDEHSSNMSILALLRRLKLDCTAHGFRSSFRDWCADTGRDRELAEAALAHVVGGVEGAYRRSDMIERRAVLMRAWADFVCPPAAGDNVLPMRQTPAKRR